MPLRSQLKLKRFHAIYKIVFYTAYIFTRLGLCTCCSTCMTYKIMVNEVSTLRPDVVTSCCDVIDVVLKRHVNASILIIIENPAIQYQIPIIYS